MFNNNDHPEDEEENPNNFLGILGNPILRQFAHDTETQAIAGAPYKEALNTTLNEYIIRLKNGEWDTTYTQQEIIQATQELVKLAVETPNPPSSLKPPITPPTNGKPMKGTW